jgi:hypothetical protein
MTTKLGLQKTTTKNTDFEKTEIVKFPQGIEP